MGWAATQRASAALMMVTMQSDAHPDQTPDVEALLADAKWMHRLAHRLVSDAARADDAVQDAWVYALTHPPPHGRSLRGWWRRVVRNAALQSRRAEHARMARERRVARPEPVRTTPQDVLERADIHERLVRAVNELDGPYRRVVLWRYLDQREPSEIAALLGVSASTVRSQLKRGLDQLRAALHADDPREGQRWALAFIPLARLFSKGAPMAAASKFVLTGAAAAVVVLLAWFAVDRSWLDDAPRPAPPVVNGDGALAGRGEAEPPPDEDRGGAPALAVRTARAPEPWATADLPNGLGTLRGRVVTTQGTGVEGARIQLLLAAEPPPSWYLAGSALARLRHPGVTGEAAVAQAVTGADGAFSFEGLDPRPSFRVRALPPAPWVSAQVVSTAHATPHARVRIVVGNGAPLRLHVVDAAGRGCRAIVSLAAHEPEHHGLARWTSGDRETDAQGSLDLDAVPRGVLRASARAPTVGSRTRVLVVVPAKGVHRISLGTAGGVAVSGTVRAANGQPIADAQVLIEGGAERHEAAPRWMRLATTNRDGEYTLDNLPAGLVIAMDCRAPGFVLRNPRAFRRHLVPGESVRIDVHLVAACVVRGHVRTVAGDPLPQAVVETSVPPPRGGSTYQIRVPCDARGRYVLGPLPVGQGVVQARCGGYAEVDPQVLPGTRPPRVGALYAFTAPGETLEANITMAPAAAVAGRVVDATGAPLAGIVVRLVGPSSLWRRYGPAFETVTTATDGAFSFPGIPGDDVLSARITDGVTQVTTQLTRGGPNVVTFPSLGSIAGRVEGMEGGAPLLSVRVPDERRPRMVPVESTGAFHVHGLPEGTVRIGCRDALGAFVGSPLDVTLAAGQHVTDVRVPGVSFLALAGTVVDPDGTPRPAHRVTVSSEEASKELRTDARGRFRIAQLVPGPYTVSARDATLAVVAHAGQDDVQVTVDIVRPRLRGHVVLPDGTPLPRGTVLVKRPPSDRMSTVVHRVAVRSGWFDFELSPGERQVELSLGEAFLASGAPARVKPVSMKVPVGEVVRIDLAAAKPLRGVVVDAAGTPLAGVDLWTSATDARGRPVTRWIGRRLRTDANGRFEVTGAPEGGTVQIGVAQAPAGLAAPAPVIARAGDTDVRVVLRSGGAVSGIVTDAAGKPVPAVGVFAVAGSHTVGTATSGADGTFRVIGIPDGVVATLQAATLARTPGAPQYVHVNRVEVRAGAAGVHLRVQRAHTLQGTVVDAQGKGIAGVLVSIRGHSVATRPDGSFAFEGRPRGSYEVRSRGKGLWLPSGPVAATVPGDPVTLTVHRGAVIEGRIEGELVADLSVRFVPDDDPGQGTTTQTDDAGAFQVGARTDTIGTLVARHPERGRVAVQSGVRAPARDLVLTLVEGEVVSGRITDPPADTLVHVYVNGPHASASTTAAPDGSFIVRGLPKGLYDVRVYTQGAASLSGSAGPVAAGTRDVALLLRERSEGK